MAARKKARGKKVVRTSKGERTAQRILDAAEGAFADKGFDAASLREIAGLAEVHEPGVYRYFESKQALYAAVLDRALQPMLDAMQRFQQAGAEASASESLPGVMTDILLEHPQMAALFQQALQGEGASAGGRILRQWLDRLFGQAVETLEALGYGGRDRADLAIHVIAMFNLTTGYFLSQRALAAMTEGRITDPEHIDRQKALLDRLVRGSLGD